MARNLDPNAPVPPPHHEVKELAVQLLTAEHFGGLSMAADAQAAERARDAYVLAQLYLGTLDGLDPRSRR